MQKRISVLSWMMVMVSTPAFGLDLGLGLRGGLASDKIEAQVGKASARKGQTLQIYLTAEDGDPGLGRWAASAGYQGLLMKGEKSGQAQNASVMSIPLTASYVHPLDSILIGAQIEANSGQGVYLEYESRDKRQIALSVGPTLRYRLPDPAGEYRFGVFAQHDVNIPKHKLLQLGLSVEYWPSSKSVPAEIVKEPVAPPVAPPSAPSEAPPPAPQPKANFVVRLDAGALQFIVSTATLTPPSQKKAVALAKALQEGMDYWTSLELAGHTDGSGNRIKNQKLSADRAEAVRKILVSSGIANDRLRAKGYGSSELLPDLPINAAEHRRVELKFGTVTDSEKLAELIHRAMDSVAPENSK